MTGVSVVRSLPGDLPTPRSSIIERAIEKISPSWAARRFQASLGLTLAGQFVGARRDRRQTEGWHPRDQSGNADTIGDLAGSGGLRSRSRDLERNDPIGKGAIGSLRTAVLGPGLNPYPNIDQEFLGLTDETADAWEAHALRLFNAHCLSKDFDFSRQGGFHEQSAQVLWGRLVNGDILAVRRYVDDPKRMLGLAIQLVEADRVCNPLGQLGANLLAGIEWDPVTGEAKAFQVASGHPADRQRGVPLTWARVPRYSDDGSTLATLMMESDRPGLMRGVPFLAPVIEPLKQICQLSDNELTASVVSSLLTVFVTNKAQLGDNGEPLGAWRDATLTPSHANNPATDAKDLKLGAGAILELDENQSVELVQPTRPNGMYDPFFLSMVKRVGIALQIPFEVLIKHYSTSYTAARAAMIDFWRFVQTARATQTRTWNVQVWEWFITECVARGYLNAPGFFDDPLVRAAWLGCDWAGPTMPQVDEVKAATAMRDRLAATVTSLEEETVAMTGKPWMRKVGQIKKERRILAEAGIPSPQGNTAAQIATVTDPVPVEEQ